MRNLLIIILSLLAITANGQVFGGFPPSTRWKQIDTDTARIIYLPGAESQADRIATLVHKIAADSIAYYGNRLRKVNILLQSRTTAANGYVALGPFRSEFFLVPTSNVFEFGNLPWQDNLAIHEYRHVAQYNHFKKGLSKAFFYLFGEQGQALGNALSVPDWFFEGDAVHAETALTPQGRGRLPYFLSGYNSLWLEGRNYSWQKLRNGSLKDYVPNHYQLGYLLVNYGNEKYGSQFWEKVGGDAAAFKGLFYPFQKAIRRHSGLSFPSFRREAFDWYKQKLGGSVAKIKDATVTDHFFPQWIGKDSLLYLKTAYNRIPAFYIRDSRGEKRLVQQDISSEQWFSFREGIIAYTAFSTHPRWRLVDYSDIVLYDIRSGDKKRITEGGRFYTPDISASGKIVTVQVTDSLETVLVVMDKEGKVLQKQAANANSFFMNPKWYDDQSIVVTVRNHAGRVQLQMLNLSTGAATTLVPETAHTIFSPSVQDGNIYFSSNASGNDEVYVLQKGRKRVLQLTNSRTGNYFPSVSNGKLAWSRFTSNGLQLQEAGLDSIQGQEINALYWGEERTLFPVSGSYLLATPNRRFAEKRYSQSKGLFNFHSWAPNYEDPEFTFSLYSDNILNTFSNELYYRYNQNEKTNAVGWNSVYGGLFTAINAGFDYTFNRKRSLTTTIASFDEAEVFGGLSIPLSFTKGKMYKFLTVGSSIVYNRTIPKGINKDSLQAGGQSYLLHYLTYSQSKPRAVQHIFPKLGWAASVQYRNSLSTARSQLIGTLNLFLPSIANHSIVLNGSWQEIELDDNGIAFSNRFALSRGYQDYYFARMWKLGANYHFPLLYPDFGIASIVFFQRIRANAFFDYSRVYRLDKTPLRDLRSVGGELYFDTKWWNQLPVSFGLRASRLLNNGFLRGDEKGNWYYEFILPINLIPN